MTPQRHGSNYTVHISYPAALMGSESDTLLNLHLIASDPSRMEALTAGNTALFRLEWEYLKKNMLKNESFPTTFLIVKRPNDVSNNNKRQLFIYVHMKCISPATTEGVTLEAYQKYQTSSTHFDVTVHSLPQPRLFDCKTLAVKMAV